MAWIAAAVVAVGSLVSSKLSSDATKEAAQVGADSIKDAQGMSDERYNQIRQDTLGLFDMAISSTYQGMQEGRDLLLSGQASSSDIINQSFMNASQTLQTSGQQSINAILGNSGQAPTIQNIQTAEQSLPPEQQTQPVSQPDQPITPAGAEGFQGIEPGTGIIPSGLQTQPVPGEFGGGDPNQPIGGVTQPYWTTLPDGPEQDAARASNAPYPDQQGQQFNPQTGEPWDASQANKDAFMGDYGPTQGPEQFPGGQLPGQAQPLEGEFIPAQYQGNQTGLDIPGGQQFGLSGATQSLRDAEAQARQDLALGTRTGLQGLGRELGFAGDEVRRGRDFGLGQMRSAMDTGRADISGTSQQGAASALAGAAQGVGFLNPYMQAGEGSIGSINALSGLGGQEAFDSALMDDPAYRYALERSEQSLGRNAALTGGIGGGNVAAELQRNAQMQAAADIDRQLGRMSNVRNAGLSAAGTAGGMTTQAGIAAGGIEAQSGRDLSNISMQGGREMSNIGINASSQIADFAKTMGISELQAMQMLGRDLGQVGMNAGSQIGGWQNQAGRDIANITTNQGIAQAGLQSGYGSDLVNLNQGTVANLANNAQGYGQQQSGLYTGLASNLTNLGTGNMANQANMGMNLADVQMQGVTNPYGNALSTMTGLYASNPDMFSTAGGNP